MNISEWELFFIAYASVLSTISIVWNIIDAIRKHRSALKIGYNLSTQFIIDNNGKRYDGYCPVLCYTVTNRGYRLLHIGNPSFEFYKKRKQNMKNKSDSFGWIDLIKPENFPKPLASGETYECKINLSKFFEQLQDKIDLNGKFRIVVQDTFGKRHKSPKSEVKSLWEHLKMVNGLKLDN
ncbi:MAG: hypothetical protein NT166_06690 [Candidatus Aminicenantes bacterium]|nr:hypothetical protein [Candidatus Aminicenantes bacterium]